MGCPDRAKIGQLFKNRPLFSKLRHFRFLDRITRTWRYFREIHPATPEIQPSRNVILLTIADWLYYDNYGVFCGLKRFLQKL